MPNTSSAAIGNTTQNYDFRAGDKIILNNFNRWDGGATPWDLNKDKL